MDRALDPDLLARALGGRAPFPTGTELASLIGSAELQLLAGAGEVADDLLELAWYLHGVASVRGAADLYGRERQRAADRVAAHVFDLSLRADHTRDQPVLDEDDWLRRCFAAQVSYVRSALDPNALALYQREALWRFAETGLVRGRDRPALVAGAALLGGDVGEVLGYSDDVIAEASDVEERWTLLSLASTPLGPPLTVVQAVRDVAVYLMYGREGSLERGRERLEGLMGVEGVMSNRDARWVAALLLDLLDGIVGASVRSVLPPDTPEGVVRAFTLATPPVLTLWPPQVRLLAGEGGTGALDPASKRMLVSAPTSAGKTLIAQLIIAHHLSVQQTGVCYVAPTRSLCREVERSIRQRLRSIAQDVTSGLPEWGLPAGFDLRAPQLEVMTPERLSYLLHAEGNGVMDRFGLFVFDEVHNIGGAARGWTLETDLAYLHEATRHTEHRIVLVSAAVSNRAHFRTWLDATDGEPVDFHSDWRGPRRLHALWQTRADWEREAEYPKPRTTSPDRRQVPFLGQLVARDPGTGRHIGLTWDEDVGVLVLRAETKEKDSALSTPVYQTIVPVVLHLAGLGPVLVVEAQRDGARRMAKAIADRAPADWVGETALRDTAQAILGPDHELTGVLEKGVAYHHGLLPIDIRTEIEDAASAGALRVIVATTTLTEGINLPVRSVVVASRGAYGRGGFNEYIRGATLLNAIGRAGRAAKETEGYVVIAASSDDLDGHFDLFDPDDDELEVRSPMAVAEALAELAELEGAARASLDAVFEASGAPADFVAFVWFVASELERRLEVVTDEAIVSTLRHSLGWVQLGEDGRALWERLAGHVAQAYREAPANRRRRWATAGMTVGSARTLETIGREIGQTLALDSTPLSPEDTLDVLVGGGRLERLLRLSEAPPSSLLGSLPEGTGEAKVLTSLLKMWVRGVALREIADEALDYIDDDDRRLERLVEVVARYFELFVPWALSDIVSHANETFLARAEQSEFAFAWGEKDLVLSDLAVPYVRWGVNDPVALQLTLRGVRSRRLALAIAAVWSEVPDEAGTDVFAWLGGLYVPDWVDLFEASPADLRALIDVVRPPDSEFASGLLAGNVVTLSFQAEGASMGRSTAELRIEDQEGIEVIGVWARGIRLGTIYARHHGDLVGFLRGRLALDIEAESDGDVGDLRVRLIEP